MPSLSESYEIMNPNKLVQFQAMRHFLKARWRQVIRILVQESKIAYYKDLMTIPRVRCQSTLNH